MSRKRGNDEMDVDSEPEDGGDDNNDQEEDDDDNMSDGEEGIDGVLSPSPETKKKDMHLRSGRRKRRRSKETSGLTPPEQQVAKKKSRTTDRKKAAKTTEKKGKASAKAPAPATTNDDDTSAAHSPQANGSLPPLHPAAGVASVPVAASLGGDSPEPSPETGRKLFAATPPPPPAGETEKAVTETAEEESKPQAAASVGGEKSSQSTPADSTNGYHLEESAVESTGVDIPTWVLSYVWMVVFAVLFLCLYSFTVDLVDFVVPLNFPEINETEIYSQLEEKLLNEIPSFEERAEDPALSDSLLETFRSIETLQQSLGQSNQGIRSVYTSLQHRLRKVGTFGKNKKTLSDKQIERMETIGQVLSQIADNPTDFSSPAWKEATEINEIRIPDTSSLQLWEIDDPIECPIDKAQVSEKEDVSVVDTDILTPEALEQGFMDVMARTHASVDGIRNDPEVVENIRQWIRNQIESPIRQNEDASDALAEFAKSKSNDSSGEGVGDGVKDIDQLISNRIEMERADRTGKYDHASLLNGAKVIYGGKRGTSKSLVDDLPLYNRIMQVTKLRFYGYGPEAAIVPTWPLDSLGQCWSFKPTSVKELMKKRRRDGGDDDHKRGSYGTLTISFPHPVNVKSVVIEHPPKGLTDNPQSAVKSFRVIGYPGSMASGKSWSLGSFEYDNASPAQEFEVATEIFRTLVPPLQSITLAIDSNWGHDFACLYRFRVHGELVEQ